MADGAAYDININARSIGVDSSAAQINQLAAQLDMASVKHSVFDSAIARTSALLSDASAASAAAAAAVGEGQTKYNQLEMAATKAAKAVEKASLSGKGNNMHVLLMEADAAAQALATEATALDALKSAASGAAAEEKRLAAALKTVSAAGVSASDAAKKATEDNAKAAADAIKKATSDAEKRDPFGGFLKGSKAVLGGPIFEKIEQLRGAFKSGEGGAAMAGVAIGAVVTGVGLAVKAAEMLATAFIAVGVAAVTGLITLATFAVKTNEKAMKSLTATNKIAEKNFAKLFSGVNVDKFTAAYADVASMLDETTSSGQALKELIGTILNPLFDSAPSAGAAVKELFKQAIILALQTATAFYLVKNALEGGKPLDPSVEFALKAAAITAGILVVSLILIVVVLGLLAAAALAIPAAFVALSVAAQMIGAKLGAMGKDAASAAANIIAGLVNGITSGTSAVVGAIVNMASAASGALVNAFKIGSPSKLFFEYGGYTAEGLANGITAGTSGVTSAMETMATPPDALQNGEAMVGKSSGSSSGKGANISGNTFVFQGVKDGEDAIQRFDSWLTRAIEGDVLQMGGEVPA